MQNRMDNNSPITLCVGFELQYSPMSKTYVDNLADIIVEKKLEFIFDVVQPLDIDQQVVMLISNRSKPTERIPMYVKSYEDVEDGHTRIRLYSRENNAPVPEIDNLIISIPIGKGQDIPYGIIAACPSCKGTGVNTFFANQDIGKDHGRMPLYSCSLCGATRTMLNLF